MIFYQDYIIAIVFTLKAASVHVEAEDQCG